MSYENYVKRRQSGFVEDKTAEDFVYRGLFNVRGNLADGRRTRTERQVSLKEAEDNIIDLEAQESAYLDRMKKMGVPL